MRNISSRHREAAAWSLERAFGEDARVRAALDQVAR